MSCGELGPIEGGLIKDSTVQDSTIVRSTFTNGVVSGSIINASSLESLSGIDDASARTIAAAISDQNPTTFASPGSASLSPDLPTYMYGSRDAVLGEPAAWMQVGDYVVPVYRKAGA